jgi:hypothetical protein
MRELPRTATAVLVEERYSRAAGSLVSHEYQGQNVVVTFLSPNLFGAISPWTMTVGEFSKYFKLIKK